MNDRNVSELLDALSFTFGMFWEVLWALILGLGLLPGERNARVVEASVTWNTTFLDVVFLALAAVLVWRFLRTRRLPMLRMMNKPAAEHSR